MRYTAPGFTVGHLRHHPGRHGAGHALPGRAQDVGVLRPKRRVVAGDADSGLDAVHPVPVRSETPTSW